MKELKRFGEKIMDKDQEEKLKYSIDMANIQLNELKLLAAIVPIVLAIAVVVIGIIAGSWWHVILYVIVIAIYYPGWKKQIVSIEKAKKEFDTCIALNKFELSEEAQKVYESNVPSLKALWFGIIAVGIIVLVCLGAGASIIKLAYYDVFDVAIFVVGLFLVCLGLFASRPLIHWILMLNRAKKITEKKDK